MATKGGVVTRKDMFSDDALNFGPEYAKNLKTAIEANNSLVDSAKKLNAIVADFGKVNTHQQYINQKNEQRLAEQQALAAIKQREAQEISMERIQRARLSTENAVQNSSRASTTAAERETAAEKKRQQQVERAQAVFDKQNTAYALLIKRRNEAQSALANLLAAENKEPIAIRAASREFERLDARLRAVDTATRNYTRNIGNYASAFNGMGSTLRSVLGAFGLVSGIALFATIMRDVFTVVKDVDRQIIAVGKTTNLAGADLQAFGREVVDLGGKLDGVSIQGLLKASEVAGQLGVRGTDNLLKFSTAIEKLKLTSNIISDEQVQNFAKFIEVSSDSFENADRLASVITQLGNNFAATESEVLANATEIQKGTAVYNSSAQSILGMAAATAALGSEAESSRSAIQSTYAVINKAIALGSNLEEVLRITGLTQAELSEQFKTDAGGVFQKFVAGLNKAEKGGENLALVLNGLGISEKRAFTVIGSLAKNYGVLERAMGQANTEYEANGALNREVEAASKSVSSILSDLKDKWQQYILDTNTANNGTSKITSTLIYLRDNLTGIINTLIKATIAWGTYKFLVGTAAIQAKLVTLALNLKADAQLRSIAATQADTAATTDNTVAEAENTAATVENAEAETAETIAETENTTATEANTIATGENTLSTEAAILADIEREVAAQEAAIAIETQTAALTANSVATEDNTIIEVGNTEAGLANTAASELNSAANEANSAALGAATASEQLNTAALDINTASEVENTVAAEASAVAQTANATATNFASAAWGRFTRVLKANALGLIIVAIVAAIYYFNKFNVSLEEQARKLREHQDAVKKTTAEYLKYREINDQNAVSIKKLSDRYDELIKVTNRNTAEQKELDEIMKILSKTVPGATTEMDRYGQALSISTVKTKAYIDAKKKLYDIQDQKKLKQNIELLKQYQEVERILNVTEKDINGKRLEGIGFITRRNNVLQVQNTITRNWRDLTNDELEIYYKARVENEANIGTTKSVIEQIKSRIKAQQELNAANTAGLKPAKKEEEPRDIEYIDKLIKAERDKIDTLTFGTRKQGDLIRKTIKDLEAEKEAIYATEKQTKKSYKNRLETIKRTNDAIYQLSQFHYQREIEINEAILENEKSTLDERLDAYNENLQLKDAKNKETLQKELLDFSLSVQDLDKMSNKKLKIYVAESKKRAKLIADGKIPVEKLLEGEILLYEKAAFEKQKIDQQSLIDKQKLVDDEVDIIQKSIDRQALLYDTDLQNQLTKENVEYEKQLQTANGNYVLLEKAAKMHEDRIYQIKKEASLKILKIEIDRLNKELADNDAKEKSERVSAKRREEIVNQLAKAMAGYSDIETDNAIKNTEEKTDAERKAAEAVKQVYQDLTNALSNLANALFERKIANIDNELTALDDYYQKQIDLAGDDQSKKDLLTAEAEKKREKLEKKKRDEQHKQAVFNKLLTIMEINNKTAQAVMAFLAEPGGYPGVALSIAAGIAGIAEIAAVQATPIPKYKDGRKGGKEEIAIVGDGGRNEVIERKDGTSYLTPAKSTLVKLLEGDSVHRSVEAFKQSQRARVMDGVVTHKHQLLAFQANQYEKNNFNADTLKKLDDVVKAIKTIKPQNVTVQASKPIDLNHDLWKYKQKNN